MLLIVALIQSDFDMMSLFVCILILLTINNINVHFTHLYINSGLCSLCHNLITFKMLIQIA